MIHLSKRLQAVADMVTPGSRPVDVGCDHAYVPIYLVENHIADRVTAMDGHLGPVRRAEKNVEAAGLSRDQVAVRYSYGLDMCFPGEADCLIIAGMGGRLICEIFDREYKRKREILGGFKEMVLSPHSDADLVRRKLHSLEYRIDRENMVIDAGKYYTIIHAVKGQERYGREEEYLYGKCLIDQRHPILKAYADKTLAAKNELRQKLKEISTPKALEYAPKLQEEIDSLEYVLSQFQTGE